MIEEFKSAELNNISPQDSSTPQLIENIYQLPDGLVKKAVKKKKKTQVSQTEYKSMLIIEHHDVEQQLNEYKSEPRINIDTSPNKEEN